MVRTHKAGGFQPSVFGPRQGVGYCNNGVTSGDVTYDASLLRQRTEGWKPLYMRTNHLRNVS
jgi:hypothetical protein